MHIKKKNSKIQEDLLPEIQIFDKNLWCEYWQDGSGYMSVLRRRNQGTDEEEDEDIFHIEEKTIGEQLLELREHIQESQEKLKILQQVEKQISKIYKTRCNRNK